MQGATLGVERHTTTSGDVVTLRGDLDLTNAGQLADALSATEAHAVILDLGGLAFVDSAGIRTIDRARSRFEEEGRRLLIVAPPESRAGWTFRVAGLADGTVLDSLELATALASSGDGQG